jgi:polyhydroxyalkanoic acid synthase PhaR subunit
MKTTRSKTMTEKHESQEPADPMEVWEQWYGTAMKGWSRAASGNGSKPADPASVYQTWLKGMADAQEQFIKGSGDPQELWKHWFETVTDAWRNAAEVGGDPLGLMAQWVDMMEEARARLLAGIRLPADPFTFFKQWYDATNETWSTLVGNVIGTEKFMEVSSEFLKSYASFYGTLRRASEEYFRNLQIPTRSDIARVAGLVVNLEEKVDRVDSALGDFEDGVGSNLSRFPVVLQKLENVEHLELRVESLEQRLNRMEGKLDAVLAALEKLAAREPAAPMKPAATARPRARRPGAERQQESSAKAQAGSRAPRKAR